MPDLRKSKIGANLELLKKLPSAKKVSLGGKLRSHAKRARPLAPRSTVHLVLKSDKARGTLSFLNKRNKHDIERIVKRQARKYFVRVESFANVGNHLHLRVYLQATEEFRHFLRSITCLIARRVTGARRGKKFGPFWNSLAFTRLVRTYTEKLFLDRYIFANRAEGEVGSFGRREVFETWYGAMDHAPPKFFTG